MLEETSVYCYDGKSDGEHLMSKYEKNKQYVIDNVNSTVQNLELSGRCSIDVMQNRDDFWIIDMAIAQ